MISTFKGGTAGWFASPSLTGCAGIFPTVFVLYLNNLQSTAFSFMYQFYLYNNSVNFINFLNFTIF